MKNVVVALLLVLGVSLQASASDFSDGAATGILLSTSALFASNVTANHSQAVYLNADQDAATYLAEGGRPSPQLNQAMAYERNFLAQNKIQGASNLSTEEVAYIVMRRAESL